VGNYPDLRAAGLDTETKAAEHWEKCGQPEGRAPNNTTYAMTKSWSAYLDTNTDLTNAGLKNESDAIAHWNNYGFKEGRRYGRPCKFLCVIAAHPDSPIKKEALDRTVTEFKKYGDVVVVTSAKCPSLTESVDILTILNDPINVCYSKYQYYLNNYDVSGYDRVILTNDSYYLLRDLDNFIRLCEVDVELVAYMTSNEIQYHYTDFLRCYNRTGIVKIKEHYNSVTATSLSDAINKNEVGSSGLFIDPLVLHHAYPGFGGNVFFDDIMLRRVLFDDLIDLVKIKALIRIKYTEFPSDFDPFVYRALNPDLSQFDDDAVTEHFKARGMAEGRRHKPTRDVIEPGFNNLFDIMGIKVPRALANLPASAEVKNPFRGE